MLPYAVQRLGATLRLATGPTNTSAPIPALPDGHPYQYALVFNSTSAPQFYAFGDSTVDAGTDPWGHVRRDATPHVVNIFGMTHVAGLQSTSSGFVYVVPVEIAMLRSPPQVVATTVVTSATSGPATAIPKAANGQPTKYVMVSATDTSSCTIAFGDSNIANDATTTWIALNAGQAPTILNVAGNTHFDWNGTNGSVIVAALGY